MNLRSNLSGRSGPASGFVDDLNDAIRENPVAAGLIGMGVLWMIFGTSKMSSLGSKLPGVGSAVTGSIGAAAASGGVAVGDAITSAGSRMSETVHKLADSVSTGAERATTAVGDTLSGGKETVASSGPTTYESLERSAKSAVRTVEGFRTPLQKNLNQALEKQPLLLGAIGLAIGAGIASAFQVTRLEQDLMGEAGSVVKDKIKEAAEFATDRANQVLSDVKSEAEVQGLTPSATQETLKGVAEKVKSAAASASDPVKQRLS